MKATLFSIDFSHLNSVFTSAQFSLLVEKKWKKICSLGLMPSAHLLMEVARLDRKTGAEQSRLSPVRFAGLLLCHPFRLSLIWSNSHFTYDDFVITHFCPPSFSRPTLFLNIYLVDPLSLPRFIFSTYSLLSTFIPSALIPSIFIWAMVFQKVENDVRGRI